MPWYVLYTKPRNEKKVALSLQEMGIISYCPLQTVIKQWSDRKKKVQEPLFSSYVFVNIAEQQRDLVFQIAGVVRYLFWLGKPAVVRDEEIETLKAWLATSSPMVSVSRYEPGTRITLTEGYFKGQSGVVKTHSGTKLQLVLESLGVLVTMEVRSS